MGHIITTKGYSMEKTVEVRIVRMIRYNGMAFNPGEIVPVVEPFAERLISNGLAVATAQWENKAETPEKKGTPKTDATEKAFAEYRDTGFGEVKSKNDDENKQESNPVSNKKKSKRR